MRKELRELLLQDWSKIDQYKGQVYGYMTHVERILELKPSPQEHAEIGQLLLECDRSEPVYTLTGVMYEQPNPVYRSALVTALESSSQEKRWLAMRALLRGGYDGAWDILFSRPDIQVDMGDEFPWEIWGAAGDIPEAWQRRCLELFCDRFRDDPPLNIHTHHWLRTLAKVPVTDGPTAATVLRTWRRLGPRAYQDRYLLIQIMAAAPVPEYEPILRKVGKSGRFDIKEFARAGLARLKSR